MNIIEKLEHKVTPVLLGSDDNVAYVSLLEQFYAVLIARLSSSQIYSQLLHSNEEITADSAAKVPLFAQLWPDSNMRQTIIRELAATHHIDEKTIKPLLISAAPLAYRELRSLADGKFLPAFLQEQQSSLRQYLPVWSASLIAASPEFNTSSEPSSNQLAPNDLANKGVAAGLGNSSYNNEADLVTKTSLSKTPMAENVASNEQDSDDDDLLLHAGAIHANPSAHHLAENDTKNREAIRTRNQRSDLLIRLLILAAALAAIGWLIWALLIKPSQVVPVEPTVIVPVAEPSNEPPAQVLTPVELSVGVDDSGSLYSCSASIGDASLQAALQQALNTSFGEQASICELTIKDGFANSIPNMSIETLPNLLTLVRATPFARLSLQNDRIIVESPDSMMLQSLLNNVRTLLPAMTVDSAVPIPLPNNVDNNLDMNGMTDMNGVNNQFDNSGAPNAQYDNNFNGYNNDAGYQDNDDDSGDTVTPAPARNNNPIRNNNGVISNNSTAPPGPISLSDVEDLANNQIVAEPAQVNRPANQANTSNP